MHCAVLGDPIEHSLSPVLHRAAYAALGLDWTYDAVRVRSGGVAAFLDGLDASWRGLSLTMPLKREVMPLLTSRDSWAVVSGAANTVLLDAGGRHGLNTDVPGAIAAIREATDAPVDRALVLGGGATAASTLLALGELGCTSATLLVRDADRARETVETVARSGRHPAVRVEPLSDLATISEAPADILVSTVPAAAQTPALLEATAAVPVVFDVVYDPWPTPLVAAARAQGRTAVTGLDLLLWQAVDQVRAMTGRFDVPVDTMREAGVRALATP
ncbi:shikimate dehydrogenase [Nocardioides cynanchi]|uniref:shikimate dehydrogenase n=1 Tax=Nocardioides cynanchi TaxID=2558918 RepID=UPI001248B601|nr:shikimate dehydrogenase [Nocardioides cynanchi]